MSNRNIRLFAIIVSYLKSILPKLKFPSVLIIVILITMAALIFSNYETKDTFTRAEYERIEIHMKLVEVQGILGRGTEIKRTNNKSVFIWESPNGSKITGIFEDDHLIMKNWGVAN